MASPSGLAAVRTAWRKTQENVASSLVEHAPLAAVVIGYAGVAWVVQSWTGLACIRVLFWHEVLSLVAQLGAFRLLLLGLPVCASVGLGRRLPGEALAEYLSSHVGDRRSIGLVLIVALMAPFFSTFTSLKRALLHIRGFGWDETFMRMDQVLHFGSHPWEWLHPLLGDPRVTSLLDQLYVAWFATLVSLPLMMALSGRRRLRMRFLLTVVLAFVLPGTALAYALPGTDPCYYGIVVPGEDPYVELMAYLRDVNEQAPLAAISNQELLWEHRATDDWRGFGGVAGMPSMHVAYAMCVMLLSWHYGRLSSIVGTLFFVTIALGSVHLGWHYAVDGYASIVGVALLWFVVGRFVRWWIPADADLEGEFLAVNDRAVRPPSSPG